MGDDIARTIIKDGYLSSPKEMPPFLQSEREIFPRILLARLKQQLQSGGDKEVLVNVDSDSAKTDQKGVLLLLSDLITHTQQTSRILYHLFNVRPGDVVHLSLDNCTQFHYPVVGAWLCNATVSPADPNLGEVTLRAELEETKAKVVFCHKHNLNTVLKATENKTNRTKIIVVGGTGDDSDPIFYLASLLQRCDDELDEVPEEVFDTKNEVAVIIWSSGTTGRPKGIQHGFRMFSFLETYKDRVTTALLSTNFFHASGFATTLNFIYNGGKILFFPINALDDVDRSGEKLIHATERFRPVVMLAGPHHVMELVRIGQALPPPPDVVVVAHDLSSLRMINPMGTTLPLDPYEPLKRLFPNLVGIGNVYGLTEFGNPASMSTTMRNLGHVAPGSVLKIVDLETGRLCGPNEIGEMRGKCGLMTLGYLNRPEEDSALFDEEGFMRFGDLGHYDEEGVLHFDGRMKELIRYKNHIHPGEIEEILTEHPGVREVAVFGREDEMMHELVTAAVVVVEEEEVTEEDLVRWVDERVGEDYKRLRGGVVFVERLPRNRQGKIVRWELVAKYGKGNSFRTAGSKFHGTSRH